MMQIWFVWGQGPVAVFSSEQRARDFIAQHHAIGRWTCEPMNINPASLEAAHATAASGFAPFPRASLRGNTKGLSS